MNKFQQLIETLQTELIILIDDDFTPVKNAQEILTYICFMHPVDRQLMLNRLKTLDHSLIASIMTLIDGVEKITLGDDDIAYIQAGLLAELLNQKNEDVLLDQANRLIDSITKSIHKDDIDDLVMMYGLRPTAGTENYNGFFEGLEAFNPKKSIRLYKGLEGAEFTSFEQEIKNVNQARNSKFPLLIVDRYLANAQDGNQIIQNLRDSPNGIDRFFSVLYTSQDAEQIETSDLQSYFHIQLRKDDDQALEKVSEALALSAFATFFNQIYKFRVEALSSANELVIASGTPNMVYLAGMAHAEGDSVFNVFNKWFDLLSGKKVQDALLTDDPDGFDMNFMISLTSLINKDFISTINGEVLNEQFHQEIEQLATYEIFDLQVNSFCSPPASGDVFEIDGQLYMLAGQECDLIVRSNGAAVSRNEKLAELVKCSFKQLNQDLKVDSSQASRVAVNHFVHGVNHGILEIQLGEKDFFDFRLLDLCCLNEDGEARFSQDSFPDQKVLHLLPVKWTNYVLALKSELENKLKVQRYISDEGITPTSITGDFSFNIQFEENEGKISFPIRRVARLKGQFREYVMQRYWQYKTRKGLNTIGLYQRNLVQVQSIQAGFPYDLQELEGNHHAWVQLTGDRAKNSNKTSLDLIIMKKDLLDSVGHVFKPLLEKIEKTEIVITPKDGFLQEKIKITRTWNRDNVSLKIFFPLLNEYSDYSIAMSDSFILHDLFGKDFIKSHPTVKKAILVNADMQKPLMGEGGLVHRFTLNELIESEIHLPEENIKLGFDKNNGKLYNAGPIKKEGIDE
ncbi:hypothetical protein [Phaeocystidibacter marisrubri]|uniref:Uncharacterized protein n=1 Tax=Phaeocystidibacter marisrubri TaxID=1577780 RepID=A0A6L3ZDS7_9FLAO|nr:hypothetical protein [Phaeocystidibacter marisrubri]KAB2816013.1 hypothetical protein F8C82_09980 [Phaeocystidibacter marisrubri]GGH66891.1 hypothetical protein GCM10011318_05300 [Phaeocystidibacter marisrubri]